MKKRLIIGAVICLSIMTIFGCGSKKSEKKDKKFEITINNDTKSFYDKIEKTDKEIPDDSKQKIEEGIQNWAKATIGIDDSFSDDTKKITDEKLYEIITSDKEREKIKQQREEFYKDSKIQTDNITVEIKKASEALYNERTIGYVEAKVTVEGKRNDDSFTNKYDLVLLMDYQCGYSNCVSFCHILNYPTIRYFFSTLFRTSCPSSVTRTRSSTRTPYLPSI